jgi:malonate decarboxylase delta subunit
MQTLNYRFPAQQAATRQVHVGVVGSGDLEVLLEPPADGDPVEFAAVRVRTSVNGFDTVWHDALSRFFGRTALAGRWELNDFGATPGVVTLRLRQAFETATAPDQTDGGDS